MKEIKISIDPWKFVLKGTINKDFFEGQILNKKGKTISPLYQFSQKDLKDEFDTIEDCLERCIQPLYSIRCFIAKNGKKEAIFTVKGEQVTPWVDYIKYLRDGYFEVHKNNKIAIFHQYKGLVTDFLYRSVEFSYEYYNSIEESGKYYIASLDNGKFALFDLKTHKRVSDFYDGASFIYVESVPAEIQVEDEYDLKGFSNTCFLVYDKTKNKVAIVSFKSKKRVSPWVDYIVPFGYVQGESKYYIAGIGEKEAIFNTKLEQVSDWFDEIGLYGAIRGESPYYRVRNGDKWAIFKIGYGRISPWFDYVYQHRGLIRGESPYFIAKIIEEYDPKYDNEFLPHAKYICSKGKEAIFNKKGEQVSPWFDFLYDGGVIAGRSEYYAARNDGKEAIFHISGKQISKWGWVYAGGLIRDIFDEEDWETYIEGAVDDGKDYYKMIENGEVVTYNLNGEVIDEDLEKFKRYIKSEPITPLVQYILSDEEESELEFVSDLVEKPYAIKSAIHHLISLNDDKHFYLLKVLFYVFAEKYRTIAIDFIENEILTLEENHYAKLFGLLELMRTNESYFHTLKEILENNLEKFNLSKEQEIYIWFTFLNKALEDLYFDELEEILKIAKEKYPEEDKFYQIECNIAIELSMERYIEKAKKHLENIYQWLIYRKLNNYPDEERLNINHLLALSIYIKLLTEEKQLEKAEKVIEVALKILEVAVKNDLEMSINKDDMQEIALQYLENFIYAISINKNYKFDMDLEKAIENTINEIYSKSNFIKEIFPNIEIENIKNSSLIDF